MSENDTQERSVWFSHLDEAEKEAREMHIKQHTAYMNHHEAVLEDLKIRKKELGEAARRDELRLILIAIETIALFAIAIALFMK